MTSSVAAIAYYALFSIVPLSLITLSVFGLVIDQDRIAQWVFDQIPLKETTGVRENVNEIIQRARLPIDRMLEMASKTVGQGDLGRKDLATPNP